MHIVQTEGMNESQELPSQQLDAQAYQEGMPE